MISKHVYRAGQGQSIVLVCIVVKQHCHLYDTKGRTHGETYRYHAFLKAL